MSNDLSPEVIVREFADFSADADTAVKITKWVPLHAYESQARLIALLEQQAKLDQDANGQLEARVKDLEREFAECQRMIDSRDEEIAELRQQPETRAVEPFVVKHYASDERPIIKGNGFDGLEVGEDREGAQMFVDWINARLSVPPSAGRYHVEISKCLTCAHDYSVTDGAVDVPTKQDAEAFAAFINSSPVEPDTTRQPIDVTKVDFSPIFGGKPREPGMARSQILARARMANGGVWPEQLISGVMFYEGERITRNEFETGGSQS